jgi:hypothetical protein
LSWFFSLAESDEGVAKGMDALSILDNPTTRVELLNQLMEVKLGLTPYYLD